LLFYQIAANYPLMTPLRRIVSLVFALFIRMSPVHAIPTDFQNWTLLTAHVKLDEAKKYQFYFEVQPRVGDNWQRMERLLIRPAVVYNVAPNLALYLGYAWTPLFMDAQYRRDYRDESRIWQQVLYKHSILDLQWQHRIRQEQRFIEHTDGVSNRFRYLLKGSYALTEDDNFGITGYDELFVTFNSVEGGPSAGYDRNRFFIGPYWVVENARYEVGYLGEHARSFGSDERYINALMVFANFNF
jgi:hypothetical protein